MDVRDELALYTYLSSAIFMFLGGPNSKRWFVRSRRPESTAKPREKIVWIEYWRAIMESEKGDEIVCSPDMMTWDIMNHFDVRSHPSLCMGSYDGEQAKDLGSMKWVRTKRYSALRNTYYGVRARPVSAARNISDDRCYKTSCQTSAGSGSYGGIPWIICRLLLQALLDLDPSV